MHGTNCISPAPEWPPYSQVDHDSPGAGVLCIHPEEAMLLGNAPRSCWKSPAITGRGFLMFPPSTGSYFQLNKDTCHPWLTISEDGFTVVRSEKKRSFRRELPPSKAQFSRYPTVSSDPHDRGYSCCRGIQRRRRLWWPLPWEVLGCGH